MWLYLPVLKVDLSGIGSFVIESGKEYTGLELVQMTINAGGWYVGIATAFMGIGAPFIQAFVPMLVCFRGREDKDPRILNVLREIGDAFSLPDMLAGGFLVCCLAFQPVLSWGLHNMIQSYGVPSDAIFDILPKLTGEDPFDIQPVIKLGGFCGMVLMLMGSSGLFMSNTRADLMFYKFTRKARESERLEHLQGEAVSWCTVDGCTADGF